MRPPHGCVCPSSPGSAPAETHLPLGGLLHLYCLRVPLLRAISHLTGQGAGQSSGGPQERPDGEPAGLEAGYLGAWLTTFEHLKTPIVIEVRATESRGSSRRPLPVCKAPRTLLTLSILNNFSLLLMLRCGSKQKQFHLQKLLVGILPPRSNKTKDRKSQSVICLTFHTKFLSLPKSAHQRVPYGLVVRIRRSHRRGPGSIPGVGTTFLYFIVSNKFNEYFLHFFVGCFND